MCEGLLDFQAHRSYSKVRMVKKMQDETEGTVRTLSSRSSKRAPPWHSSPIIPKSLSGQPLDQVWIRLARKGFWGNGSAMSCGGSFRRSWWERSHSAFSFVLHFFYHPNLALGTMWDKETRPSYCSSSKAATPCHHKLCFSKDRNDMIGIRAEMN